MPNSCRERPNMNLNRLGLVWVEPKHNTALKLATHTPLYHSSLASPLSPPHSAYLCYQKSPSHWHVAHVVRPPTWCDCFICLWRMFWLVPHAVGPRPPSQSQSQTSDGTSYGSYHSWFGLGPVLGGKRLSGLGAPHLLLLDEPRADKAQHKRVSDRRRGTHTPTHTHRGAYEL